MHSADYYARQAAEHSAHCTPEENERRQVNGRKSNISCEFGKADTDVLFRGIKTTTKESEYQPTRFGGFVGAFA